MQLEQKKWNQKINWLEEEKTFMWDTYNATLRGLNIQKFKLFLVNNNANS